jgi:hypothetical protein
LLRRGVPRAIGTIYVFFVRFSGGFAGDFVGGFGGVVYRRFGPTRIFSLHTAYPTPLPNP